MRKSADVMKSSAKTFPRQKMNNAKTVSAGKNKRMPAGNGGNRADVFLHHEEFCEGTRRVVQEPALLDSRKKPGGSRQNPDQAGSDVTHPSRS